MPINIIERAVTPYNSSPNSLVNKEQYSVYAPGADIEKPGMAGFSAEFFAVAQQIVSLNARFLKTLLRHKVFTPDMNSSGAKEVNTLYSSFSAEVVVAFAPMDGTPRYTERTGSLLVLDGGDEQIEILFAEDGIWTRRVALPGYETTDFLPLHNMPVNGADILYNTIGTAQLIDGGVTTEKLADASVSQTKLSPSFVARVSAVERNVENLREISVGKTSDPSRVYATASDGSPAFLPYAENPTAYSVPQRDGAGRVKTASPASASDAVDFSTFSADKERVGKLITDLQTAVNRLSRAFAFDNWEAALVELTKPALAEAKEKYRIGDAILIRDVEAPDGWVSGYAVSPMPYSGGINVQNPFDGADAFTVGWLIISPLEAPKLSLDGYATTEEAKAFADAAEEEAKSYAAEEVAGVSDRVEILGKKVGNDIADAKAHSVAEAKAYTAEEVAGVSDRVEILGKKVENLRAALSPEYFTEDSSVAYAKTVPDNALPFAEVAEVGGMSYAEDGMASAAVTEIETVGYNVLDLTPALNNRLIDNGDGTYTLRKVNGERFSEFFPIYIPKGQQVFCYLEIVGTNIDGLTRIPLQLFGADKKDNGASIGISSGGQAFSPIADTFFAKAYLQHKDAEGAYVTFRSPMIKYGKSAEFSPYAKHTYPIPAEVQNLDGWGDGISADCHNRLDWSAKQYRQEVWKIRIDGTEEWRKSTQASIFQASIRLSKLAGNTKTIRPIISNGYGFSDWYDPDASLKPYFRIVPNGDALWIEATLEQFASVEAWKAYLAEHPVEIVYPLASPIVTDLPNLTDDNFIEVEGGGTVTAVNEHGLAAPTKIEYQLKEAMA